MKDCFLGIDIGTYESKGVLVDSSGAVLRSASRGHTMESPRPGWAEHDAETTWWGEFCQLSRELLERSGVPAARVAAVGCSTIAPCCLPVDEDCRPLRKAILYGVDVRAMDQIDRLNRELGAEAVVERYGTPITSQSAAAKILWIRENEPEVYRRAARFVTGTTFLVAKLTGEYLIDHYTAATWVPLYDPARADWCEKTLPLFCRRGQLARCEWTDRVAGTVTREASAQTGLAPGTPVIVGTADASAEATSAGVYAPGDMMIMYGSSIFMIHVTQGFVTDPRLWAGPYLFPGTHALAAGMSAAGTLTRWLRDQFSRDLVTRAETEGENPYALMMAEAADIPPGSGGLVVLPYMSGERTPINDPLARGMIFGLNLHHTRAHVYQACLEGVGYGIAQHFDILAQRGVPTRKIVAIGGGTRNPKWLQIVSDILGRPQWVPRQTLGACYGDALLAALAVGRFASADEIGALVGEGHEVAPRPDANAAYQPLREMYGQLYESTKTFMHRLG